MNKFILLVPLLMLSACAAGQAYNERITACGGLAQQLAKPKNWSKECVSNDTIFSQAFEESVYQWPKNQLCGENFKSIVLGNEQNLSSQTMLQVTSKRKINCNSDYTLFSKRMATESSVQELCSMWSNNVGPEQLRLAVRKEVKVRQVNCPAVMVAIAQQEQAQAQKAQAIAQSQAAMAAMQANIQASRPKTCYSNYGSVTCY